MDFGRFKRSPLIPKGGSVNEKRFWKASVLLAFLCSILLWHPDASSIVNWGYDLLASLFSGGLREFPRYTYETHGLATNYSLFVNVIDAAWELPLFLIERLIYGRDALEEAGFSPGMFELWYKLGLFLVTLFCGRLMWNLMEDVSPEMAEKKGYVALGLFFSSGILCVSVLGKGQVDIFSLFFLLAGARCLKREYYMAMSLLFGLSFAVKPFPILMVAAVYVLLLQKMRWRAVFYGLLSLVPYAADALVTRLLMPDYGEYVAITSREFQETFGFSRVEQLFAVRLWGIPLFPLALAVFYGICLWRTVSGKVTKWDYLLYPAIAYLLLCGFYSATFYWYVAIVPILAWMAAGLERRWAGIALLLCNTLSMLGVMVINVGGMGMAAFRPLMLGEAIALGGWLPADALPWLGMDGLMSLFRAGFLLSMVGVVGLYLWQDYQRKTD